MSPAGSVYPWTAFSFARTCARRSKAPADILVAIPRAASTPAPADSATPSTKLLASANQSRLRLLVCQTRKTPISQLLQPNPGWTRRTVASAPAATPATGCVCHPRMQGCQRPLRPAGTFPGMGSSRVLVKLAEFRDRRRVKTRNSTPKPTIKLRKTGFTTAKDNPLSTFSIDVDTASYSNVRRFLQDDRASAFRSSAHRGDDQLFLLRLSGAGSRQTHFR